MLKYSFKLLIFQNGRLSETLNTTQEFADVAALTNALINFAAHQSAVRLNSQVMNLYTHDRGIDLPPTKVGYGPETVVVIDTMTQILADAKTAPTENPTHKIEVIAEEPLTLLLQLPNGCVPGKWGAVRAFAELFGEVRRRYPAYRFQFMPFVSDIDDEKTATEAMIAIAD